MTNQAALDSSAYIAEKATFLQNLDNLIEAANEWKPFVAGAAILERGFLEDEGLKRESELALESLTAQDRGNTCDYQERIRKIYSRS